MTCDAAYSHLTGCGGAGPGRRCAGSPCLSRCSPSRRESPLDCPKPATLPLKTHVIHSYKYNETHAHCYTQQSLQTLAKLHIMQNTEHQQAKNKSRNTTQRKRQARHHTRVHTHSERFNPKYLLHRPHMQQNQRNSGIRHQ